MWPIQRPNNRKIPTPRRGGPITGKTPARWSHQWQTGGPMLMAKPALKWSLSPGSRHLCDRSRTRAEVAYPAVRISRDLASLRQRAGRGVADRPLKDLNQIVLHLGNGASASAIAGGRPQDTSMGLTPLEGLVMGARSGDIDAGIVSYLHR